ncbi:hypothetical protein QJQ45_027978, partial [Haematococcus lacustris]
PHPRKLLHSLGQPMRPAPTISHPSQSQLQGSSQHHPALSAPLHLPGLSILTRPATNPVTSPAKEQQPIIHTTEEQDEQTMPPSMPKQQQDWDDECLTLLCSFAPDSVKQLCTLGKKLSVKMLNEYCKAVGLYVPANTLRADLRFMVLEHLNGQAEWD